MLESLWDEREVKKALKLYMRRMRIFAAGDDLEARFLQGFNPEWHAAKAKATGIFRKLNSSSIIKAVEQNITGESEAEEFGEALGAMVGALRFFTVSMLSQANTGNYKQFMSSLKTRKIEFCPRVKEIIEQRLKKINSESGTNDEKMTCNQFLTDLKHILP